MVSRFCRRKFGAGENHDSSTAVGLRLHQDRTHSPRAGIRLKDAGGGMAEGAAPGEVPITPLSTLVERMA